MIGIDPAKDLDIYNKWRSGREKIKQDVQQNKPPNSTTDQNITNGPASSSSIAAGGQPSVSQAAGSQFGYFSASTNPQYNMTGAPAFQPPPSPNSNASSNISPGQKPYAASTARPTAQSSPYQQSAATQGSATGFASTYTSAHTSPSSHAHDPRPSTAGASAHEHVPSPHRPTPAASYAQPTSTTSSTSAPTLSDNGGRPSNAKHSYCCGFGDNAPGAPKGRPPTLNEIEDLINHRLKEYLHHGAGRNRPIETEDDLQNLHLQNTSTEVLEKLVSMSLQELDRRQSPRNQQNPSPSSPKPRNSDSSASGDHERGRSKAQDDSSRFQSISQQPHFPVSPIG